MSLNNVLLSLIVHYIVMEPEITYVPQMVMSSFYQVSHMYSHYSSYLSFYFCSIYIGKMKHIFYLRMQFITVW